MRAGESSGVIKFSPRQEGEPDALETRLQECQTFATHFSRESPRRRTKDRDRPVSWVVEDGPHRTSSTHLAKVNK
jgi:hypothetical protein